MNSGFTWDYNRNPNVSVTLSIVIVTKFIIVITFLFVSASGLSVNFIIPVICSICIFYTTIGGIKGLVWTDTIQFTLTFGVISFLLFLGISKTGGIANIWNKAVESGRLDIFE